MSFLLPTFKEILSKQPTAEIKEKHIQLFKLALIKKRMLLEKSLINSRIKCKVLLYFFFVKTKN